MLECKEYRVKIGFKREPKDIFDEIEQATARFIRQGYRLNETVTSDFLDYVDLLFVREI
ncbi:MAG: hypothetical protein FWF51_10835 [Chitinivibrionia bacterium]|jgi:hypothetical protein|nr:hypothetical protein [Chitinivibrionia bacterium]